MWKNILAMAVVLGLCFGSSVVWADEEKENGKEEKITLDEVPAAVKAAILKEAGDAKILEIEKETKDGAVTYKAEFEKDGKKVEVAVDESGKVLSREAAEKDDEGEKEEKVALDQLPAEVKATVLKEADGAKILEVEKKTEGEKVIYDAEFEKDGKNVEIKVNEKGKLLSRKAGDDDKDGDDDDGEKNDDSGDDK